MSASAVAASAAVISRRNATPMLVVSVSARPSTSSGSAMLATILRATICGSSTLLTPSRMITNSSPPRRATVSVVRTLCCSRRANALSTSSPAAWPRLSLMPLKRSMSRYISAMPDIARRARDSASGIASLKA